VFCDYGAKGQYSEAVAEFVKMTELVGMDEASREMHDAYANGGWNGYLRYVAENGTTKTTAGYKPAYPVAASFAELGEKDEAFAWLEKAYAITNSRC
jgi:hypothetical protein